jgi:thioredoxin reductase (NADPH)
VENYPGYEEAVSGTELVETMRKQAQRFGARYRHGEVVSSDFSGSPLKVELSSGEMIETATVVIATGATAKYLGLDSEQKLIGRGVSACATCDGAFYRNQDVAVIGGGDTAAEEALFLARLCSSVTLIHRRDQLRASKIMAERVRAHAKIKIMWDTVVEEMLDVEQNEVTGLRLKNVKTDELSDIAVSGIFVAIGHQPNTDAFRDQIDMDEQGFINAANTRTSVPGVFAAGDVQDRRYKQAVTAAGTGCIAALEVERYLESQGQ